MFEIVFLITDHNEISQYYLPYNDSCSAFV